MSITNTERAISNNIFNFTEKIHFPTYIDTIFERVTAKDVEQFYSSYQLWLLQRRVGTLQTEIDILQQAVANNEELMQGVHISPITLANLAQLQAYGVNDIDLLDRMSEQGEGWLDHTMQLLKYCEEMGVIRGNYTQWCEHALDGAYNWISSIATETELETPTNLQATGSEVQAILEAGTQAAGSKVQAITEEELLQKLMSDEGDTEKMAVLPHNFGKVTQVTNTDQGDEITPEYRDEAPVVEVSHATPAKDKIEGIASIAAEDEISGRTQDDAPTQTASKSETVLISTAVEQETALEGMIVGEEISIEDMPNDEPSNTIEQEGLNEDDPTPTDKFAILTVNKVNEPVEIENEQIAQEENGTESCKLEINDASIAAEVQNSHSEQTTIQAVVAIKSNQENKKPSLQKVQRKGFWWFLRKLLLSILRR